MQKRKKLFWLKIVLPPGKFPGDAHVGAQLLTFVPQHNGVVVLLLLLFLYRIYQLNIYDAGERAGYRAVDHAVPSSRTELGGSRG